MLLGYQLKNAIEQGDIDAQVAAQEQLAFLSSDAARLGSLKHTTRQKLIKNKLELHLNKPAGSRIPIRVIPCT
jgi:hypothetical protein